MALTGKFEFRKTFWGKIVLRVEEEVKPFWQSKPKRRWCDATLMDLAAPEMRYLIDIGRNPWAWPVSPPAPPKGSEQRTDAPMPVDALVPAPIQQASGQKARTAH